jgi:hypothetical protein
MFCVCAVLRTGLLNFHSFLPESLFIAIAIFSHLSVNHGVKFHTVKHIETNIVKWNRPMISRREANNFSLKSTNAEMDLHALCKLLLVCKKKKICICSSYMRPPLWSSGQSSWLQIQISGFDSQCYQIFWEVVGLEQGSLSLWVQLRSYLKKKVAGPVYKTEITAIEDPLLWLRDTLYPQKLAVTSRTSGGCSVGIFPSRTKAMEFASPDSGNVYEARSKT